VKKILLIGNNRSKTSLSYDLISQLSNEFSKKYETNTYHLDKINSKYFYLLNYFFFSKSLLKLIKYCDIIIYHSPVFFHFTSFIFAKILGKKIVVLVWDTYPVTISGQRFSKGITRRLADFLELRLIRMAALRVVPSEDFLDNPGLQDAKAARFWARPKNLKSPKRDRGTGETVRLAFAGQINETRGFEQCLAHLDQRSTIPVEVHVYSHDSVDFIDTAKIKVIRRGIIPRLNLLEVLGEFDYGIVCLNKNFDNSGFPSKTFDYIAAGLPVIYYGKNLEHFISILKRSGIGIDITNMNEINFNDIGINRLNYQKNRDLFLKLTSVNDTIISDIIDLY